MTKQIHFYTSPEGIKLNAGRYNAGRTTMIANKNDKIKRL